MRIDGIAGNGSSSIDKEWNDLLPNNYLPSREGFFILSHFIYPIHSILSSLSNSLFSF
jgi:hypothetical protein